MHFRRVSGKNEVSYWKVIIQFILLQNVGCDWKLQSKTIEDQCGICNGNGQECDVVNGTLRSDQSGNFR